ncbi:MAG: hypothetical protein QF845_01815 [Candidatus Marinimicrobia bacterium]|nr:hypothetical protein [Candidatus Neomarinimicrobiota bacterium]MDP6789251.1 hypothetical protein [Candidatus Neomarinimicrobiota bacterium]MDP7072567.1 hypothetical protein [Candidatus Neomarinimicrobiota bacterium]
MIYLLLSDSHITGAHCSSKKDKQIITAFFCEKLPYPLSPYFGEEEDLSQILFRALSGLQQTVAFEESSIAVAVSDTLVHHDITEVDKELPLPDAWDYIQWKHQIQWGNKADTFLSFSRVYEQEKTVFHTVHCDSALVNAVNLSLKSLPAFPIWMGTESSVLLENSTQDAIPILIERTRGFDVFHKSDSGPAMGKLTARKGSLSLSCVKGNADSLAAAVGLATPKTRKKPPVNFFGRLTQAKHKTIESLRVVRSNPFKMVSIENDNALDRIDPHDQSVLSEMISGTIGNFPQNFFLSTGIQDTPEKHKSLPRQTESNVKPKKKKKPLKKPDPARREKTQKIFLTIVVLIIFIGMYILGVKLKLEEENSFPSKDAGYNEILADSFS